MPTRNVMLTKRQERLIEALREVARLGVAALDRGEFREFERIEDLQTYLNDLSEKVILRTAE